MVEWITPNISSHSQGIFTIDPQREDTKNTDSKNYKQSLIGICKSHPSGISNSLSGKGVSPIRFDEVLLKYLMNSQWNYQEQPEHAQTSYLTKRLQFTAMITLHFNAKHGRNSRGMGPQGLEQSGPQPELDI